MTRKNTLVSVFIHPHPVISVTFLKSTHPYNSCLTCSALARTASVAVSNTECTLFVASPTTLCAFSAASTSGWARKLDKMFRLMMISSILAGAKEFEDESLVNLQAIGSVSS